MTKVNDALFGAANRFSAFLQSTNQKANITEHAKAVFSQLGSLRTSGQQIFLDVGCGEGELTVPILKTLLEYNSDTRLVGVDPSETMTSALSAKLDSTGLAGELITEKLFEHPSGSLPEGLIKIGKGDIVLCSHAIYYAEDLDRSTDQILDATAPEGILVSVHQSKRSQMHELRKLFSTSSILHPSDGEPLTADHMEDRIVQTLGLEDIAKCEYTSDLYFADDTPEFLNDFMALLDSGQDESGFQTLIERYGDTAVIGRNVLEFILREDLFEVEAERAKGFIEKVSQIIDSNSPAKNGKPRIIISESISFASRKPETQMAVNDLAREYQLEIDQNF